MPIAELKATLSETIRGLDTRPRPLVVTLNGKPAAVIMSPREFDQLTYHQRVVQGINEGLADIEAGRVVDAEEAFADLLARYSDSPRTSKRRKP